MFIVFQEVWAQSSGNYDAVKRNRTLSVTPETTVGEIMQWAENCNVLAKGDVTLTTPDTILI